MLAKRLARHRLEMTSGALAAVLSQSASAGVPASVVSSTIKAASLFAAGQAAVVGAISVQVVVLTEGVLKTMLLSKLKIASAVLLTAAVLSGATGLVYRTQAGEKAPETETLAAAPAKPDTKNILRNAGFEEGDKTPAHWSEGANSASDDDVANIPSQDLRAGKDENKRYFLIGPAKDRKPPKQGYSLLVVLPGGPGTADFHPFVKRIYKYAVPESYLVAQHVSVKWTDKQTIVWPTAKTGATGMKFTTEQFIDDVIDDVAAQHRIDKARIFTLSWSSSGPAAYAASLTSKKVTGSFVAMSVYNPNRLPDLKKSQGHAYYLYHSKEDRICPYRMAERAAKDLESAGAKVKLVEYAGGHGWRGPLYDNIRQGIRWLEKNHATNGDEKKLLGKPS